jgi:phage terminase large subunit-like protein
VTVATRRRAPRRRPPASAPPGDQAERAVKAINLLTHTKGPAAGEKFHLRPWQEQIIRQIFTTRADGRRQYRTALLMLPRKNGKSELCAALAIYFLLFDGEAGGEIYSAAADKEQAALVFNVAAQMIRNDPRLEAAVEIVDSQKRIVHRASGSFYRAISAEAYSKHGFNASVVIYDELHAAPDRELWDVLVTSQGARLQPITIAITTAGFDRTSILWELYSHARRVAVDPALDPTFLPIIFEAPIEADWTDEAVWRACNPALGDFRSLEDMRVMFERAKLIPAQESTFRRLYLNQWVLAHTAYFSREKWDACRTATDAELAGAPCFGGLDVGQTDDFTAWVRIWLLDDGRVGVRCRFWIPEAALHRYPTRPYDAWRRAGLLEVTTGDTTDLDLVERTIVRDCQASNVRELGFDKRFADHLAQHLQGAGILAVDTPQGFALNEAIRQVGAWVVTGHLAHNGDAILGWMADNTVVHAGQNNEIRLDKRAAKEKIDGIAALVMAAARALGATRPPEFQMYRLGR